jgi:hypothetical protein
LAATRGGKSLRGFRLIVQFGTYGFLRRGLVPINADFVSG